MITPRSTGFGSAPLPQPIASMLGSVAPKVTVTEPAGLPAAAPSFIVAEYITGCGCQGPKTTLLRAATSSFTGSSARRPIATLVNVRVISMRTGRQGSGSLSRYSPSQRRTSALSQTQLCEWMYP
jgi:hypothetical protein